MDDKKCRKNEYKCWNERNEGNENSRLKEVKEGRMDLAN